MKKTRAQRRREARMAEVVRLRDKGWSLRQIASQLDVDHTTVRADLVRSQKALEKAGDSAVGNPPDSVGNPPAESNSNIIQFQRRAS